MESTPLVALTKDFAGVDDPRMKRTQPHPLHDIVVITLCALIAGAETWEDIALFGETTVAELGTFLALPNGIPSHDTFNWVFAALDPAQFQARFAAWMQAVAEVLPVQVIAVRRSHDRAWASANRLVLRTTSRTKSPPPLLLIGLLLPCEHKKRVSRDRCCWRNAN